MGGNGMQSRDRTGSCSLSDNSIAYRMMLRFRPIAPKPVDGQSVPTDMPTDKTNGRNGRVKRKSARIRKNKHYNSNRKSSNRISPPEQSILTNEQGSRGKSLMTLQLLPTKRSDDKEDLKNDEVWCNIAENSENPDLGYLCQWNDKEDNQTIDFVEYKKVVMQKTIRIETWVTVEKVTNTCMDGVGLGFSDVDKMNNIRLAPCPGFVSDFSGKVQWVNEAYKKLVSDEEDNKEHQPTEFGVQLVVKEELPYSYPSFACTVRLEYALGWRKRSRIVPCDVWRMDFGGFAWKLDIKASLSLGLQPYSEN